MNKNLISLLLLFVLVCFGKTAQAQQNEKIIFPNPANYQTSAGSSVLPTADGGYLVLGQADGTNWNTFGYLLQPRIIKLDANLNTEWDNLFIPLSLPFGELAFPKGQAFELPDGDFLLGLHNDSSDVHLLRINADGSLDAEFELPGQYERSAEVLDILDNGNYLVFVTANQSTLKHLDPAGNVVFSANASLGQPILLANGDLLFRQSNGKLTRTDNQGAIIWQVQPSLSVVGGTVALPAGGFGVYFFNSQFNAWRIQFFNDAGVATTLSPNLPIPQNIEGLKAYPDGTFLASGTTGTNRGYMLRVASDGTLIWSAESPDDALPDINSLNGTPTADGWAIGGGTTLTSQMAVMRVSNNTGFFVNKLTGAVRKDNDENCAVDPGEPVISSTRVTAFNSLESFVTHTNSDGKYQLNLPSGDFTIVANPDYPFFFPCPTAANTASFPPNLNGQATLDIPIQSMDIIHEIKGTVTLDENDDCLADPNEPVLNHSSMQLQTTNGDINFFTNSNGEYQVFVPSGDYTLHLSTFNSSFGVCNQANHPISITGTVPQTVTENFVVFAEIDCAQMEVIIGDNQIRPCTTDVVTVSYRNGGTQTAENVTVELVLDPALQYLSASPAPISVSGNVLQFDLGDVAPAHDYHYQNIKVNVLPDCALQIGQQLCLSAHVSPDVVCKPAPAWQGAIIALEGECSNTSDSVIFRIRNIGNGPNLNPLNYIIDEDLIVLLQDTYQLPAGGVFERAVLPLSGTSTVSITAQQEPGAPGDSILVYSLTNCIGTGGGSPTGLGGNPGQFGANQCFEVVNSYDPNEKTAFPLGFGAQHLVRLGTPLEYTIHFQNTGNDTAYTVILRDTLSDKLDWSQIRLLASSHPYEIAQINDSILHIRFDNILLPDSLTNPEGSQGFISFKIYPKGDLAEGTVVNNHAAIYFDQNAPIITNTVWRTYGDYFLVSTDEAKDAAYVQVSVSPNPFVESAIFELPDELPAADYLLEVFDAAGKLLRQLPFQQKNCWLQRDELSGGIHFWTISRQGKVLARGKIVAGN